MISLSAAQRAWDNAEPEQPWRFPKKGPRCSTCRHECANVDLGGEDCGAEACALLPEAVDEGSAA